MRLDGDGQRGWSFFSGTRGKAKREKGPEMGELTTFRIESSMDYQRVKPKLSSSPWSETGGGKFPSHGYHNDD